jgi:1,4-alpha-glucan branching enzyme
MNKLIVTKYSLFLFIFSLINFNSLLNAQVVPVTFSYYNNSINAAELRGEFTDWGPIGTQMTLLSEGHFIKTVNLNVNQGNFSQSGQRAYNYKFWSVKDSWTTDPLNPFSNAADNNNSLVYVKNPMIFQPTISNNTLITDDQNVNFNVTLTSAINDSLDFNASKIDVNGKEISNWTEFYNSQNYLLSISGDTLKQKYFTSGSNVITIELRTQANAVTKDSVKFVYQQAVEPVSADLPAGWRQGVTIISSDSVGIVLFAPKKDFVYLIGDFNDYTLDPTFLMNKHEINADSVYWWLGVGGLSPSMEYGFQYLINGQDRVADPYSQLLLVPGDDNFRDIPASLFPNRKPYPTGKTQQIVGVFSTRTDWLDYNWEVENFERPKPEELVIYEMLVRDWVSSHSYQSVIDSLDYLTRLGVNALQLMPVMEFEGNESWGYNTISHFAVDKYYGTPQKLKELIDECHKRGIAVILDIVFNHMYGQSPLVRLYNDGDFGLPTLEHPYFNRIDPNTVFSFGYDMNQESTATKAYIDSASAFWLEKYKVDGFRYDFTKGMTNTRGDGGAYDASRVQILKRMGDEVRKRDSTAYLILEHFADTREERELNDYGFMSWAGGTKSPSQEAAMGYHDGGKSNLSDFYYGNRGFANPYWVGYLESHDEERLMFKMEESGASEGSYSVQDQETALERMKAMGVFFLIPGPKMIWQFGELGYDFSIDFNGRTGNKPIRWDYQQDESRLKIFKAWSEILRLRKTDQIFSSGSTNVSLNLGPSLKTYWLEKDGEYAYVAANLDTKTREASLLMPKDTTYYDFWTGNSIQTEIINRDPRHAISMEPGSFKIFTTKKFDKPTEGGLVVSVDELDNDLPVSTTLMQNYPNPFNPATTINYYLKTPSLIELSVYDLNGRKVATIANNNQNSGWHTATFDASNLSSGIYIYRLVTDNLAVTKKMTLIK